MSGSLVLSWPGNPAILPEYSLLFVPFVEEEFFGAGSDVSGAE
jgi:hypothetical protein